MAMVKTDYIEDLLWNSDSQAKEWEGAREPEKASTTKQRNNLLNHIWHFKGRHRNRAGQYLRSDIKVSSRPLISLLLFDNPPYEVPPLLSHLHPLR